MTMRRAVYPRLFGDKLAEARNWLVRKRELEWACQSGDRSEVLVRLRAIMADDPRSAAGNAAARR
jgi:hypothetical protein